MSPTRKPADQERNDDLSLLAFLSDPRLPNSFEEEIAFEDWVQRQRIAVQRRLKRLQDKS
jgi:hypothetical protein